MAQATITAEILDAQLTEGFLSIEVEGQVIRAELTADMDDTAQALPELVKNLEEAGYQFAGEATDVAGEVELIRL